MFSLFCKYHIAIGIAMALASRDGGSVCLKSFQGSHSSEERAAAPPVHVQASCAAALSSYISASCDSARPFSVVSTRIIAFPLEPRLDLAPSASLPLFGPDRLHSRHPPSSMALPPSVTKTTPRAALREKTSDDADCTASRACSSAEGAAMLDEVIAERAGGGAFGVDGDGMGLIGGCSGE